MITISKNSASLDELMVDNAAPETDEPITRHFSKGAVVVIASLIVLIIGAVIAIASIMQHIEDIQAEKTNRMAAIASALPAETGWSEVASSPPALEKRKIFYREWKTDKPVNIDELVVKTGATLNDVAYPSGCKEGATEDFFIQLCVGSFNKTVSILID